MKVTNSAPVIILNLFILALLSKNINIFPIFSFITIFLFTVETKLVKYWLKRKENSDQVSETSPELLLV